MFTLRPYQRAAVDGLWDYYRQGNKGNPILTVPTGGGKSLIQATFLKEAITQFPVTRFMCLTHVGELVDQNAKGIKKHWPEAPAGVYAAGLGRRDTHRQITVGAIQSVYNKAYKFGHIDILIVDEAQLISGKSNSMYQTLIDALKETNPHLRVVGLTATAYRMDCGSLIGSENSIFTDIAYTIELSDLVNDGYLCPLISKRPGIVYNLSGVRKAGGEFVAKEADKAVNTSPQNIAAVNEMFGLAGDRNKWLVFATSVDHAYQLNALICAGGRRSAVIEGKLDKGVRASLIKQYQNGALDCLVNVNVLTTGFDAPDIDMVALCRGTQSTGLYVQMLGRGLRLHDTKINCLVLDFGQNILTHGPVDAIPAMPPARKKRLISEEGQVPMAPAKLCPQCQIWVHAGLRFCDQIVEQVPCNYEFPPSQIAIEEEAETEAVMASQAHEEAKDWKLVLDRSFTIHTPKSFGNERRISSIKATYLVQRTAKQRPEVPDWICVEHGGEAGMRARQYWINAGGVYPPPKTLDDFMRRQDELDPCTHIIIKKQDRYWRPVELGYFGEIHKQEDSDVIDDADWELDLGH